MLPCLLSLWEDGRVRRLSGVSRSDGTGLVAFLLPQRRYSYAGHAVYRRSAELAEEIRATVSPATQFFRTLAANREPSNLVGWWYACWVFCPPIPVSRSIPSVRH